MSRTGGGESERGMSAPEAIVALLLGLFVVHLGLATLARLRTAEAERSVRADELVAMRVARHVLRRELRHAVPGRDWLVDPDSLSLRAFRGTALVCAHDTATAEITVAFTGDRQPDPSKDSVLLLDAVGGWRARALTSVGVASEACGPVPADSLERWGLDAAAAPGSVVARLYERGSYHLHESALRYRRGASGRQPLTPEVWSEATAWVLAGGRLGVEVHLPDTVAGPAWSAFLAWTNVP